MRTVLRPTQQLLAVVAVAVALTGFLAGAYAFHLFGGQDCWVRPTGPASSAIFTIVMADGGFNVGYNGSRYQSSP